MPPSKLPDSVFDEISWICFHTPYSWQLEVLVSRGAILLPGDREGVLVKCMSQLPPRHFESLVPRDHQGRREDIILAEAIGPESKRTRG